MAKKWAKSFYNSKAWENCRTAYVSHRMNIDGGLCEECHKEQGYIVHHIINLTPSNINNPEISLNHSNLKYVCKDCHDRYEGHFINSKTNTEPIVEFDEYGQPIDLRNL